MFLVSVESMNEKPKMRRPGSGRTKGSFSFVRIPLSELNKKFADQTTPITVSRMWAQQCGFKVKSTASSKHLYD